MIKSVTVRANILHVIAFFLIATQIRGETVIDFRKGDDLKILFDGGLRPWRVPGLGRSHLEVGPDNIAVVLPTGETLRLAVERATFTVVEGNKLAGCELYGLRSSVNEAVSLTKTFCGSVSIPVADLDPLVVNLGTKPDPTKYWTAQNIVRGNLRLQITFQPIYNFQKVDATVRVFVGWKRPPSEMRIPSEPIKPPSGYEGVSMDPPKQNPNAEPFPKHGPDYYRDLTNQARLKDDGQDVPTKTTESVNDSQTSLTPAVTELPPATMKVPIWGWVIGTVVLALIAFFFWKRRV